MNYFRMQHAKISIFVLVMLILLSGSVIAITDINVLDKNNVISKIDNNKYETTGDISNLNWSTDFALPGFNQTVKSSVEYNGELYVVGLFSTVNNIITNGIAKWDGTQWLPVIDEFDGNAFYQVSVYNGELIVSGSFNSINGVAASNIAAWDGSHWRAITTNSNLNVKAMAEFKGDFYIAGDFSAYDSTYIPKLIKWDGVTWKVIDIENNPSNLLTFTSSLEVYNNELYVAGDGIIKSSDGITWSGLASGLDNNGESFVIYDMVINDSMLVVSGSFANAGGVLSKNIAEWDGNNWLPLENDFTSIVTNMCSINDKLYVRSIDGFYEYDNGIWSNVPEPGDVLALYTMFEYNSELVVGGIIVGFDCLLKWDGTSWSTFDSYDGNGCNAGLSDMIEYDNKLVCLGDIDKVGNLPVNRIAAWNGSSWESLNNSFGTFPTVGTIFNNNLVIGSIFQTYYNEQFSNTTLMQYDGTNWYMVGDKPVYGRVRDMIEYNGMLVVVGNTFTIDGVSRKGIFAVDSDNSIISLGSGSLGENYSETYNAGVYSLAVYNGKLYAGGSFTFMDSIRIPRLAVYDGIEWKPVEGSTTNIIGSVSKMEVYNDNLIVYSYGTLHRFDGSNWYDLDVGDLDGSINVIKATPDVLLVGGDFNQIGGVYTNGVALWNGSCWGRLGDGVDNYVFAAAQYDGDYYFGGSFNLAGETVSNSIAKYSGIVTPCDCCRGIRGNYNNDINDEIDVSDLVSMVTYSFGVPNSPGPSCIDEADIDASGTLDISDIVGLVAYMFNGGDAPNVCP